MKYPKRKTPAPEPGSFLRRIFSTRRCSSRPRDEVPLSAWLAVLTKTHYTPLPLLALFAWMVFGGIAKADIGGSVPGPGGCDYPMTGASGAAFGEYDYACAGPTEINGSHWLSLYGGGMWQANAGISIMFINASVTTPVGVLRGITYWACPDLSMAEPPNPPGAWKSYIAPRPCKTIAPKPELLPDGPPSPPPMMPGYVPPANNLNPVLPNPDGTDNPH